MATFPDEPIDEERLEEVDNDEGQTPFRPADDADDVIEGFDHDDIDAVLDDTHPVTDAATNIQAEEAYDEGEAGAAEASEPNAGNKVIGYDPSKDQRRQTM